MLLINLHLEKVKKALQMLKKSSSILMKFISMKKSQLKFWLADLLSASQQL
jgi:hypothetical protein